MADTSFEQHLKELAGTTLPKGNYRLLELIAFSHMSVVYKATDDSSHHLVAIKILANEEYLWRFKAEAKIGYLLHGSNLASTIRAEMSGETLSNGMTIKYLVMKWIDGISLSDVIRENRQYRMPTPELLQFTVTLLQKITPALQQIHDANIIHRDIKPGNIRFHNDQLHKNEPYLLDFGIAKWVQPEEENQTSVDMDDKTQVWQAPGTHKYMPPEQWEGEASPRSDEYALALMVYEILSDGYSPYEKTQSAPLPSTTGSKGADARKSFNWKRIHQLEQPLPIQEHRSDVPQSVWMVLLRAMNKNPVMRYESVTEFTEAFIKAVQQPATPVAPPPEMQRTIRQDMRDLMPPAAPAPAPIKTARLVAPPQLRTRPTEEFLKAESSGRPIGATPIPPMKRADSLDNPNKPSRSMLPFAIIGLVIVAVIVAALIVVPALNRPADMTLTPTDLFAVFEVTQTADAAAAQATTEVISPTSTDVVVATSTAIPVTDTVEPSATPTDMPPTTEVPAVELIISNTDTPTSVPPSVTSTKTATPTKTLVPTASATKTASPTNTPTPAPTKTPVPTATKTATATATYTPSATATATITPSPTPSATATIPPLDVLDLLTQMRDAGRRANQFNCVDYIKAYDGLQLAVSGAPDDAQVAVVMPLLAHSNDPVTTLYTFCKLPANVDQSRVLLRSNLANNQYRVWGSLISQAITDVEAIP